MSKTPVVLLDSEEFKELCKKQEPYTYAEEDSPAPVEIQWKRSLYVDGILYVEEE